MPGGSLQVSAPAPEALVAAAFERGRCAERARLAQDLHDDIGARLLTMMVRTRDPALADSLRETLRDRKVLTRGLAAPRRLMSEAAAEWRQELRQRLDDAGLALHWRFGWERDVALSVEQWSALTRALRELVSNVVAHAGASQVWVEGRLEAATLRLALRDDGHGCAPQAWAQGLGVGGVRRRVEGLGGSVRWSTCEPHGIRCELNVPLGGAAPG